MSDNTKRPNVQYFILHKDGRREILWRYCRSYSEARMLRRNLQQIHNAQRVWF